MKRKDAIELGLGRYRGELCSKHRELRGERLSANGYCYGCHKEKKRARFEADPEPIRKMMRLRQRSAKYRLKRQQRDRQPEAREAKCKRRRRPERRARNRARHQRRFKVDVNYRLSRLLRKRMHAALDGRAKTESTFQLIGCTADQLRRHLEAQFVEGMSWENYGEWHIDHIRPCASFDLSNPLQQRAAFNFVNLRPLWGSDNASKGSTWGGSRWTRHSVWVSLSKFS